MGSAALVGLTRPAALGVDTVPSVLAVAHGATNRAPPCASGLVIERPVEGEICGGRLRRLGLGHVTRATFPYT